MEKKDNIKISEACDIPHNAPIVVVDDIRGAFSPSAPSHLIADGFILAIVLQGSAKICIDNVEYSLGPGDIFGCNPRNIVEKTMLSIDLQLLGFYASPDYVSQLLANISVDWSFMMLSSTHDVLHAEKEELDRLVAYINLIRQKLNSPEIPHKQESLNLLIQSMGLELFDIHNRECTKLRQADYSPAEHLIQRFLLMLSESAHHGKPYLNVNRYAEQLSVSAKYFSLVCKQIIGKTASEVINEDIMRTAMVLLKDNSLNIKQISDRLGFANQSHFGTFFRRHTGGKSPQDFRTSRE